jgi:hypothetical protein
MAEQIFGCRVLHGDPLRRRRGDPGAADVQLVAGEVQVE